MSSAKTFYISTLEETVLPVTYIEKYKDEHTKALFAKYKFNSYKDRDYFQARISLERFISDIVLHVKNNLTLGRGDIHYFTSPPSTMFARGEKAEDSMRELLRQDTDLFTKIFSVKLSHIKNSKAQHLGSSRKKRLAKTSDRYSIYWKFKFMLMLRNPKHIQITILDDVCSTGGTLLACKQTLQNYMQKKKPGVGLTIQVFSIAH